MPGGEISIQTALQPTGLWITVPITIGGRVTLLMVLDPGSPVSSALPQSRHCSIVSSLRRGRAVHVHTCSLISLFSLSRSLSYASMFLVASRGSPDGRLAVVSWKSMGYSASTF